jgi:hypothetical protein
LGAFWPRSLCSRLQLRQKSGSKLQAFCLKCTEGITALSANLLGCGCTCLVIHCLGRCSTAHVARSPASTRLLTAPGCARVMCLAVVLSQVNFAKAVEGSKVLDFQIPRPGHGCHLCGLHYIFACIPAGCVGAFTQLWGAADVVCTAQVQLPLSGCLLPTLPLRCCKHPEKASAHVFGLAT